MGRRRSSRKKTLWSLLRRLLVTIGLCFLVISITATLVLRWFDPPGSAFIWQSLFQGETAVHQWRPLSQISQQLALMVIAAEDQRFPDHHGFDLAEIQNAVSDSIQGDRLRGASTITQQVAKNLFLWRSHSLPRKVLEAWFTIWIELFWSKQRILEVYLNVAEFGPNVYGAQAASSRYFKIAAKDLDRGQAALMAAVLPNPRQFSLRRPSSYTRRRARAILVLAERLGGTTYLERLHH